LKSKLNNLNVSNCLKLKEIDCSENELTELDLTNLTDLEMLNCVFNQLTNLDLSNLFNLKELYCRDNYLISINYPPNPEKLIELSIRNNNLDKQNLSIFSKFTNLQTLFIGNDDKEKNKEDKYNHFFGDLEGLKNLTKLESLHISNTDIDGEIKSLPNSIREIYCSNKKRPESAVKKITEELAKASNHFTLIGDMYLRSGGNAQE